MLVSSFNYNKKRHLAKNYLISEKKSNLKNFVSKVIKKIYRLKLF